MFLINHGWESSTNAVEKEQSRGLWWVVLLKKKVLLGSVVEIKLPYLTHFRSKLQHLKDGITELINYGIRKRHPACGHYSVLKVFCSDPRTRFRKSKIMPINMMIIINGINFLGHPNRTRSRWRRTLGLGH